MALQELVDAWMREAAREWRPLIAEVAERGEGVYAMTLLFTRRNVHVATMLPPGLTQDEIEETTRNLLAGAMQRLMFGERVYDSTTKVGEGD